jgi:hypothetical protein
MKDMGELEELIAEIKANRRFDALEMEFIHTRAKGIFQLMQLLLNQMRKKSRKFLNSQKERLRSRKLPEKKTVMEKPKKAVIPEKERKLRKGNLSRKSLENEEFRKNRNLRNL